MIGGCYALTLVLAIMIYINRLYTTKQLMEDIPKLYVPIKKGDLPGRVRRRITEGLSKGAILAWQSKPKARPIGNVVTRGSRDAEGGQGGRDGRTGQQQELQQQQQLHMNLHPIWGEINHPGWSPEDSIDLPNVEYAVVIAELPHIIEDKAKELASQHQPLSPGRKPYMSLARYISYLTTLGYVDPRVGEVFVNEYERCRFWASETQGVAEADFRLLMKVFAALLRAMDGNPIDEDDHASYSSESGSLGMVMRGGIEASVGGFSSAGSSRTGTAGVSIGTFGSVIPRPPIGGGSARFGFGSGPDTDYDTEEYEYTDQELERRPSGGSSSGIGMGNGLRRVLTQSTSRSDSSSDGSVRRTWGGDGAARYQPEEVEMRYLRARRGTGVRQRTSQGTFGQ